jgi:hypothetical protein
LTLHEGLLTAIHALNNVDLFSHSLLKFLHSFRVDSVTILEILSSSQMCLTIFLNVFYSCHLHTI